MDYANSRRIKVWGTARVVEDDPQLLARLVDPGQAERAILFTIEAWDVNCPQHIHKRYPQKEVAKVVEDLQQRIQDLEAQLTALIKRGTGEWCARVSAVVERRYVLLGDFNPEAGAIARYHPATLWRGGAGQARRLVG
jgi:hypothetical protein